MGKHQSTYERCKMTMISTCKWKKGFQKETGRAMLWPPPGAFREIHPWTHSTLDRACFVVFHCFLRFFSSEHISVIRRIHRFFLQSKQLLHLAPPHLHAAQALKRTSLWPRSQRWVNDKFLCSSARVASNDQHIVLCFAKAAIGLQKSEKSLEEIKEKS